jgi:hypothetical protein
MTKKCDYCKEHIDIGKGGYANVYNAAHEMKSYHLFCFESSLMREAGNYE